MLRIPNLLRKHIKPCPIRKVDTACGTPIAKLSKLCQIAMGHLTTKENLPLRCKSTNEILKKIIDINETHAPLSDDTIMAFPDITDMYPNVDTDEANETTGEMFENEPSEKVELPKESLIEALQICQNCNCITFNDRYYLPCRGCSMGPSQACDLTDIWIGPIAQKHVETCPVDTAGFIIYRDDAFELLLNGEIDLPEYLDHLDGLHPNIKWEAKHGREGVYLDLQLFIKNGKIESKVYSKSEPIYLPPNSCHDRSVFKGLYKTVGLRLRLNNSLDSDFDEAVKKYSRAFAVSGHNYQKCKAALMEIKRINRINFLKNEQKGNTYRKKVKNTKKLYWISQFDPRLPHQRWIISKNYHLMAADPKFLKLFPRNNIISGNRR